MLDSNDSKRNNAAKTWKENIMNLERVFFHTSPNLVTLD